ncbi:MAG: hypothetical protein LKJ03_00740 [Enterococcaceae bacterium]|jgi:hypothetical protein|nr:hypothetical protein [Enterococcaceae bacterium]MCI1919246.1 hypothetical protein [Enterococcaceae bacterium]
MNKAIIILLMAAGLLNMAGGYRVCAAAEVDIIQETAFLLQQFGSHFKINRKTSEDVGKMHTAEQKSLAKLEEDAREFPPKIREKKQDKKAAASTKTAETSLSETTASKEPSETSSSSEESTEISTASASAESSVPETTDPKAAVVPQPAQRTDGFYFNGNNFELAAFSGSGYTPQNTPYVYQWSDDPTHYLFERNSPAGRIVRSLTVGSTVSIRGVNYTVFEVEIGISNDERAYDHLKSKGATVTWQVCDTNAPESTLSFWYAK